MKINDIKVSKALIEIEKNHNTSWYEEVKKRNEKYYNDIALLYRGNKITYLNMLGTALDYANSLERMGVKQGDEIPVCVSNCPELVYLLFAASKIGAKVNIFASEFDKEYLKEIINNTKSKVIFVSDNNYEEIKDVIEESNVKRVVIFSLTDSLKDGVDPYESFDLPFYEFKNKFMEIKKDDNEVMSISDFVKLGFGYKSNNEVTVGLDDEFLITYTSGSTNTSRPKAIVHPNRSLITMGRFHDSELSGMTNMKTFDVITQAHIPPHSNTDVITSISDTLMQHCTVALEPIYDPKFFIYSLLINKASFVPATRSFWIEATKEFNNNPEFKNVMLPWLMIPAIVGEPNTDAEERYINKMLRERKAGSKKVPFPVSPVCLSFGGGDCEHGGLFFTLYKSLREKSLGHLLSKESHGLVPFKMVDYACLDEFGNKCKPYEYGVLAANSPCTMKCYRNNPEATDEFFVKDSDGKLWGNLSAYGYIDKSGNIHMKGRVGNNITLSDGLVVELFKINDEILKEKRILSSEVVKVDDSLVAHIELLSGNSEDDELINVINYNIINRFGLELSDKISYRIRSLAEGYPLTGCGKRSNLALQEEGLEKAKIINNNLELQLKKEKNN
ncbi:MAG: class I adenylate-forming enzyme family protein [Clostridia bacterium]